MSSDQSAPADWYPDATGRYQKRYWDGHRWTEHVVSNDQQTIDPVPVTTGASQSADLVPEAEPSTGARVGFFGARKTAQDALTENTRLQALINQYGLRDVADLEAVRVELRAQNDRARSVLVEQQQGLEKVQQERRLAESEIVDLRAAAGLQEFGLYDYENPAENSVSLATQLESLRSEIKRAVRAGQATSATANFTFNNSSAKGAKFVRDMSKLMLRAYNAEAENCVKTVRAGNLDAAQKRLGAAVDQIARLGTMIDLHVTPYFHSLRLRELELASRHLQALQVEKELERSRREELREQRRAEQELAREKERLEKEHTQYRNVLSTLVANGDEEGAERIRARIADVERAITDVDYRAANIRAGFVYVISNVGSFGPDVVKIGMTRRLEPMDRVNELGDASVPFRFDVHALFVADDAVSVETGLHRYFSDRRINRVNLRREYFRATPAEVLEALKQRQVEVLEFTVEPVAAEYRSSVTDAEE